MQPLSPNSQSHLLRFGYTPAAISFLGLGTVKGIGFSTLRNIGGPLQGLAILEQNDPEIFYSTLSSLGAKSINFDDYDNFRREIWNNGKALAHQLADYGVHFLTPDHSNFPASLNDLPTDSRPQWLFVRGNVELLSRDSIAVVGTRKPSVEGEFLTRYVVSILGESETVVVSGLAHGIDSIAHDCALHLKLPTISILGSGILRPYPAKNIALAEAIVNFDGALVSEYMPFDPPTAESFVWRNRLQAAISKAVIATEWKISSGTAHTIRFAKQLKRVNISTSMSRMPTLQNEGRASTHFDLPHQHINLLAAITDVLHQKQLPITQPQTSLF
jgi:DNA processing protein